MQRFLILTLLAFGSLLALNACGKSSGASSNMNTSCYYSQTQGVPNTSGNACNYNYSATPGFSNYASSNLGGYAAFGLAGGCSGSQTRTYSDSKGLGCVDSTYLNYFGVPALYSIGTDGTFDLMNSGAVPGTFSGYGTYGYNSATTVVRSCDGSDGCPGSEVCRAPTGVSPLGLGICYLN